MSGRGSPAPRETAGVVGFGLWITVGLPLTLLAFWVAVSYLLMVAGWILGLGELQAFPELYVPYS